MSGNILRIELMRKPVTYIDYLEVGLYALVYDDTLKVREYVTWIINNQFPEGQNTSGGHYYQDLQEAIADFKKRQ